MFRKKTSNSHSAAPRRRQVVVDTDTARSSSGALFRRNQTLSGYRRDDQPEASSRQKAHHLASQRRRLGGIFVLVIGVALFLGFLLWQLVAQVQVTTSTKQLASSFDTAPYDEAIQSYLGLNPAQRLRFALDQTTLSAYVTATLPEVEAVKLASTPGIAEADFAITFRTPVAGWQINSQQYYVDANGVVFEKNYYQSPTVQIVDESGVSPEQGTTVVGTRLLGFLGKVVAQAGERGYTVTKAVLPQNTTRELDVTLEGAPTRVKLAIDRGAGEQVEDMARALQYLKSRGMAPQYIDVRVSGRAAYQ